MKILFVCSANKLRSKTGEDFLPSVYPDHEYDSAGTNKKTCDKEGTTYLTEDHLVWADLILVMESKHRNLILANTTNKGVAVHPYRVNL